MHPGYGFLSESAEFVEAIEKAGVAFLGPTSATMRMFSRKHTAREFAISADVPVLPGTAPVFLVEKGVQQYTECSNHAVQSRMSILRCMLKTGV